jgi:hypothetical protein
MVLMDVLLWFSWSCSELLLGLLKWMWCEEAWGCLEMRLPGAQGVSWWFVIHLGLQLITFSLSLLQERNS